MHERSFRRCKHCLRKIFADHGLGEHNLILHEESCLDQQRRERERASRRASKEYRKRVARSVRARGEGVVPSVGQLGFPFDGVPEEVIG